MPTDTQFHIVHVDRPAGRHYEVVNSETGEVVFAGSMGDALTLRAELNEVAETQITGGRA